MDRKFFFFRREPESETSASFSDTGVGLSTIAIPSENLTFVAAKEKVIFTFKDCNRDESSLKKGSHWPKPTSRFLAKKVKRQTRLSLVINFMSRNNLEHYEVRCGEQ